MFRLTPLNIVDGYQKQCSEFFFFKILIFDARTVPLRFSDLLILAFGHNFWTVSNRKLCLVSMDSQTLQT